MRKPQGMVPSPERDLVEGEHTRGIVSKAEVLWGIWSEAEGCPTGDGSVQLEVKVVRDDGPWVG